MLLSESSLMYSDEDCLEMMDASLSYSDSDSDEDSTTKSFSLHSNPSAPDILSSSLYIIFNSSLVNDGERDLL